MLNIEQNEIATLNANENADNYIDELIRKWYTIEDEERITKHWLETHTIQSTVEQLAKIPLDKVGQISFTQLSSDSSDTSTKKVYNEIITAIMNLQERIMVKFVKGKVVHKKGEYVMDKTGANVVMGSDGKPMTYKENVYGDDKTEPLFPLTSPSAQDKMTRCIHSVVIPYDFESLREQYANTTNPERAKEIVKELFTKYYDIGLTDKVFERIMVWFCNAKSKALGYHPLYPCVFAIVGTQGTGKSWLAEHLQSSFAHCFKTRVYDSIEWEQLFDKFNTVWEFRGIIPLNEVCAASKADRNTFKNRVTSKTVVINPKFTKPYTVQNWTTLFSATNDRVIPLFSNDENRRIIEVIMKGRRDKDCFISNEEADPYFEELWRVLPTSYDEHYGDSRSVFNQMLDDSNVTISEEFIDVAVEVFEDTTSFIRDNSDVVKMVFFKKRLRDVSPNTNWNSFYNWLKKNNIISIEENSSYRTHFNREVLDAMMNSYGIDDSATALLKGVGAK